MTMPICTKNAAASAIALSLGLALSACNPGPQNRGLESVNQPVVEHATYSLDLNTTAEGLPISEQRRLADWFESLNVGFRDRISLDGSVTNAAVREDVAAIAGRYGLLLSDGAPVTAGYIEGGTVRVVITRSRAYVPNCPNWSDKYATSLGNQTDANYGCAVNANLAAMVANPDDLLHGATPRGETVIMSSNKAIETYRAQKPTGTDGLPKVSTENGGK
jgi:pilus assembly protein CpaD